MANFPDDQKSVVWVSVPLDGETVRRLQNLSDFCHADPQAIAASLLHDVLKDDEAAHCPETTTVDLRYLN